MNTGLDQYMDIFKDAVDDSADPNLQTASLENPDVAPDMPDYMSDADIQMA